MTTTDIAVDLIIDPVGVTHLISPHPSVFDTLCGQNIRTGKGKPAWTIRPDERSIATCLPCAASERQHQENVRLGNSASTNGVTACDGCGGREWQNDFCTSCGAEWTIDCEDDD